MAVDTNRMAQAGGEARPGVALGPGSRSWLSRPPRRWIYRNLTPWRIELRVRADDEKPALTVPPLGETRVLVGECGGWDTSGLRRRGQLEVVPEPDDLLGQLPRLVLFVGWLGVLVAATGWAIVSGRDAVPPRAVAAGAALVPVLALLAALTREAVHGVQFRRYRADWRQQDGARRSTQGLGAERGDSGGDGLTAQITRRIAEALVMAGAVAVAVVGTALAIYCSGQLRELLPIDLRALLQLKDPFHRATASARASRAVWQLLIGSTAQWVLVSVAALVPAAMYFQFDRERLAAIQSRWVRQVFRLDPTVRNLGEVQAKYGASIEASFGAIGPTSSTRLMRGRRSPVIVATILSTVGWIVLACGTRVPRLELVDGRYRWPTAGDTFPVAGFFEPQGTALGFAFLGAYLFAVFHVVRGYQRRDLLPKTYNLVVVRYLAAYILTLAAEAMFSKHALDNPAIIGFAFFAGFLPQRATVRLSELVRTRRRGQKGRELDAGVPLTELEGIDLYDRTRLEEEGINNVHALAHADLVELMSATRIPADRLVDWTDQAILFLRVGGEVLGAGGNDGADAVDGDDAIGADTGAAEPVVTSAVEPRGGRAAGASRMEALAATRANMRHLRTFGIRNASDLVQAYDEAIARGAAAARCAPLGEGGACASQQAAVDQFRDALSVGLLQPGPSGYLPIQGMLDTLPDEEWFTQIRNWRRSEFGQSSSRYVYLDGNDLRLKRRPADPDELPCRVDRHLRQFPMRARSGPGT